MIVLPLFALFFSGCSKGNSPASATQLPLGETSAPATPVDPSPELLGTLFSLGFDTIRPVYEPEFAAAGQAPLQEDELVIGIALNGEAKAYPITVLRFREMVNDELAGIPVLVTW